ncbi:MAG: TlpA family protein disulfide reductase [Bacteroidota bacterium]
MKKIVLSLIVIAAIAAMAFKPDSGILGKMFPVMVCEDYNGTKVTLPVDTKGKYTLLGMAFSNDAETNLKTWINPIYNKFIEKVDDSKADVFDVGVDYDINLYFIPMFTGLNQLTSKQSKDKIKKATDKELYGYLLFYSGDKSYKEELDFEKKEVPYFFVLDPDGQIVYATTGSYDDQKLERILDAIEEN